MSFDEYVDELERRRDREKAEAWNRELATRLQTLTKEEVIEKLLSCLSYPGVVGEVLVETFA